MGRLTVPSVDPNALVSGEENVSRLLAGGNVTMSTGVLRLGFFTARKSEPVTTFRALCGTTGAGATPTLVRYGVYAVDAAGDLSLAASTANDTGLLATPSTAAPKALSATYQKVAGARLALGILVVTGATAPTVVGISSTVATETALAPRLCGVLTGQTDLPSSISAGSLVGSSLYPYAALS